MNKLSNVEWAKGMLSEFEDAECIGKNRDWIEDFDKYFKRLREIYGKCPPSGWVEVQALKMVILLGDVEGKFGEEFDFNINIESKDGGPSKMTIEINYNY